LKKMEKNNPTFSQQRALEWKSTIDAIYENPTGKYKDSTLKAKILDLDYLKHIKGKTDEEILDSWDQLLVVLLAMDFMMKELTSEQTEALLKYMFEKYQRPVQEVWKKYIVTKNK